MTKAQLIAAMAPLSDDAVIHVRAIAETNLDDGPDDNGDLGDVTDVVVVDADGPDAPAFGIIEHRCEYLEDNSVH